MTIKEIAKALKLSTTTVSVCLANRENDPRYKIRPEKAELIRDFARKHGYVPDRTGRSGCCSPIPVSWILNSQVAMVNLIGGGDFLIEDSVIEDNEFITLRTDYGATWDGTITIKNSTLDNNNAYGRICTMLWTNHDFGYTCHFPNFILDNIKHKTNTFELESTGDSSTDPNQDSIASWGDYLHIKDQPRKEYAVEPKPRDNPDAPDVINKVNVNPLDPPDFIIAKNCKNVVFRIADVDFFDSTMIRGFKGYPDYNPNEALPTK